VSDAAASFAAAMTDDAAGRFAAGDVACRRRVDGGSTACRVLFFCGRDARGAICGRGTGEAPVNRARLPSPPTMDTGAWNVFSLTASDVRGGLCVVRERLRFLDGDDSDAARGDTAPLYTACDGALPGRSIEDFSVSYVIKQCRARQNKTRAVSREPPDSRP